MSRKMVRCKPCGYIMEEGKLKDKCPACGMDAKFFEPYTRKFSERRRFILNLDLHPIAVHGPQFITTFIPLLLVVSLFLPTVLVHELNVVVLFLSLLFPISVGGAFITGLIDGKVRFKKLATPALIKKIIWGSIMVALSTAILWIVLDYVLHENIELALPLSTKIVLIALNLGCVLCAFVLGTIGKNLMGAKLPG